MVAVPSFLLDKAPSWSEADFERYRLHSYFTERILARSAVLQPIGEVAAAHHERIDGTGSHRGLSGSQLSMPARLVAAASAYMEAAEHSLEIQDEPEPILAALGRSAKLDGDCLAAVAAELGASDSFEASRRSWPAGLTEREVDVLRLVATGLNLKEAASRLVISDHTARHHLESVYSKSGVSSRAGATLFAVENGLL